MPPNDERAFSWLTGRLSAAYSVSAKQDLQFQWYPEAPATPAQIAMCEESVACALSPGHKAFLQISNGARFSYDENIGGFPSEFDFVVLSTRDVISITAKLVDRFSNESSVLDKSKRFDSLIPVVDYRNNEFLVADVLQVFDEEYAIRWADNDLGPNWWRKAEPIGPSFESVLQYLFDYFIRFGKNPGSREEFFGILPR